MPEFLPLPHSFARSPPRSRRLPILPARGRWRPTCATVRVPRHSDACAPEGRASPSARCQVARGRGDAAGDRAGAVAQARAGKSVRRGRHARRVRARAVAAALPVLATLVTTKSWWDTVDGIAANVVGPLVRRNPGLRPRSTRGAATTIRGCDARRSCTSCATAAPPTRSASSPIASRTPSTRTSSFARRSDGRCANTRMRTAGGPKFPGDGTAAAFAVIIAGGRETPVPDNATGVPMNVYGITNCDTVKEARAWLAHRGVSHRFIDFKKVPPTRDQLKACATRPAGRRCSTGVARRGRSSSPKCRRASPTRRPRSP